MRFLLILSIVFLMGCEKERNLIAPVEPPYETDETIIGSGSVKIIMGKYDTDVNIRFYTGNEETMRLVASHGNATIEMVNGGFRIGGFQIIGPQQNAIADASGQTDTERKLNLLLEACRKHGLIARGE